jgi:hypothetical protein
MNSYIRIHKNLCQGHGDEHDPVSISFSVMKDWTGKCP